MPGPTDDSLRVQLSELNNRARWYSSQLWQVPFAYLGASALVVADAAGRSLRYIPTRYVFWCAAALGVCVFVHTLGMRDGERRAVKNLRSVERALELEITAQYKASLYVLPLQFAIVMSVVVYVAAGFAVG
jgi:hypothetical protein